MQLASPSSDIFTLCFHFMLKCNRFICREAAGKKDGRPPHTRAKARGSASWTTSARSHSFTSPVQAHPLRPTEALLSLWPLFRGPKTGNLQASILIQLSGARGKETACTLSEFTQSSVVSVSWELVAQNNNTSSKRKASFVDVDDV